MQTYEILVKNRAVLKNSEDMTLVRTSIGIDQVHVLFDNAEWLEFPIKITFSQGSDIVTQPLVVSGVDGSDEWVAEATVTIPYEVIDMVGPINVTLQGTDSGGRHIITAKGSPLSVEEAGDVIDGSMPEDAPTMSEWEQAYADAMTLMNDMQTALSGLQSRMDAMVEAAKDDLDDAVVASYVPATSESLGVVRIGDGLSVTEDGVISTNATNGITGPQLLQMANLARLASMCFDTEFDDQGVLADGAQVKTSAVPIDGTTIVVNDAGKLCIGLVDADGVTY